MRCTFGLVAWMLGAALAATAGVAATEPDAVAAVAVLRAGGCGGRVALSAPLLHSAVLDQAAQRWAEGGILTAQGGTRYPDSGLAGVHVQAPPARLLEVLSSNHCSQLAARELTQVGAYARGVESWIVVAGRRSAPVADANAQYASTVRRGAVPSSVAPPTPIAGFSQERALALVNAVRARGTRCGNRDFAPVPPLSLSGSLGNVAQGHATDMAQHGYFEHTDLAGQTPADRVRAVGYHERLVGENIAYGSPTLDDVMRGWLDSPGHCENIMDPRFAQMGIASDHGHGSRQGLYWVQVFAEPTA
ncbi:MAG: CAP domain-containing protein [Proteobacteria bacterium]|nr:CAP domain-containing protein [Pseudomonadota bacterium]